MSRKTVEPKTPLAARLTETRLELGFSERDPFAKVLGVSMAMLGNYERGNNVPDANVLARYQREFSVNINWLLTGDGQKFINTSSNEIGRNRAQPDRLIQPKLLSSIKKLIHRLHKNAMITLRDEDLDHMAVRLYNDGILSGVDYNSEEEFKLWFELIEKRLQREINEAISEPGKGKHSA